MHARGVEISALSESPMRQCAVSRARGPRYTMLRLGLDPDRRPFVDVLGRAPGRGVYVVSERQLLQEALSPKGLARIFRGRAAPLLPEQATELLDDTVERLRKRVIELLQLARRAGKVEIGMDAVLAALRRPNAPVVLQASDLSPRSAGKLQQAPGALYRPEGSRCIRGMLSKAEIGLALGRSDVGVVAIRPSKLAERLVQELARLSGLVAGQQSIETKEND